MDGGFFRGTSQEQDSRFADKQKKMMKSMKFPPEYNTKIDMKKIKLEILKPWISAKITELLGFEDELLIGYVFSLLEEKPSPDPKELQINITGFLATDASDFMLELWRLLLSAQNSIGGIPAQFLDKKKEEIRVRKVEADRISAALSKKIEKSGDTHATQITPDFGDKQGKNAQDTSASGEKELTKKKEEEEKSKKDKDRGSSTKDRSRNSDRGERERKSDEHQHREKDKDRHSRRKDKDHEKEKDREKEKGRDEDDKDKEDDKDDKERDRERDRDKEKGRSRHRDRDRDSEKRSSRHSKSKRSRSSSAEPVVHDSEDDGEDKRKRKKDSKRDEKRKRSLSPSSKKHHSDRHKKAKSGSPKEPTEGKDSPDDLEQVLREKALSSLTSRSKHD